MKSIPFYQVDAFSKKVFSGNPAAVCILDEWLTDKVMQSIASENNLSETAFINMNTQPIGIRWFTPECEMGLCGHATLASARVLFDEYLDKDKNEITFSAQRGLLKTIKKQEQIFLDFPADKPMEQKINDVIEESVGAKIRQLFKGHDDYLAILDDEDSVRNTSVNMRKVSELNSRGLIISAKGDDYDFVSRCFYPKSKIDEDPVTGSAHTLLIPYWADILKKDNLKAYQCSERGGSLNCELKGERVFIGGYTARYLDGTIHLNSED
ncbi:MAG: PhzF family phenazine biosynthesis protein [Alphaproteobacteria bacterium]|jgi:PhzF family phenazine biosynthesis protein|nr:MAG: PhzF family phenazine biosynthesis protein [Alphaproteobacteria bacterium]|tara:strand:- start:1820 stop:2620 length:801 start_codon:yes stop_codon:yes gene_type:complete